MKPVNVRTRSRYSRGYLRLSFLRGLLAMLSIVIGLTRAFGSNLIADDSASKTQRAEQVQFIGRSKLFDVFAGKPVRAKTLAAAASGLSPEQTRELQDVFEQLSKALKDIENPGLSGLSIVCAAIGHKNRRGEYNLITLHVDGKQIGVYGPCRFESGGKVGKVFRIGEFRGYCTNAELGRRLLGILSVEDPDAFAMYQSHILQMEKWKQRQREREKQ